ncbi:MAG: DUF1501 domain-containing protein [Rubripirellula sp.]
MAIDRRSFLVASATGYAGLRLGPPRSLLADERGVVPQQRSGRTSGGGKAKSVILFFLCGGASHIDTWDMKPDAPSEYRGPFSPIATASPEIRLCEHLPLLAKQAHHFSVVRSVGGTVNTNDHHAGYYYNLTGHVPDETFKTQGNDRRPYPDDWPFMGSVVSSRANRQTTLPGAISLPHMPSRKPYTRPGQFAAKLGVEFDPLYVDGSVDDPLVFQAPSLMVSGDVTREQFLSKQQLFKTLDKARAEFDSSPQVRIWKQHQERTMNLLLASETTNVFDLEKEPVSVRERYGKSVNAMSLLLARRLVQAEVPFVTVFWKENEKIKDKCKSAGGWDTHGNNFGCLKEHLLPEVEDLAAQGMLDETLLVVNSEMGRQPKIGDRRSGGVSGGGRDHWTHCQSVLMAGGGIQGGQSFGSSDRFGEYPSNRPVTPADITKTVYHATGTHDLIARDSQNRPFSLLEPGKPIMDLF